jgi:hypothetical protein
MGRVRPFVEEDIPEVVALRQKTFRHSDRATSEELGAYFHEMFVSTRWRDEELPSLVYEDAMGRTVGFIGVFPRRMLLEGEPIRVAIPTQLMVHPENRGTAALELVLRVLRGEQHLSLTDAASDVVRRMWEKLGGRTALLYSLTWTRPLRPWRHAVAGLGGGTIQRAIRLFARPLLNLGDATATRLAGSSYRQTRPAAVADELAVGTILEYWPAMRKGHTLVPEYDEQILEYLLEQLAKKSALGVLQRVVVREAEGSVIGWYLYYLNAGVGEVVQLAASPDKHAEVLDHMFYHAWRRGAIALRGRLQPKQTSLFAAKHCYLNRDGGWTAVHSRRPEIVAAVQQGDALISRLEGEFWMTF